jgi:hypothetical protein
MHSDLYTFRFIECSLVPLLIVSEVRTFFLCLLKDRELTEIIVFHYIQNCAVRTEKFRIKPLKLSKTGVDTGIEIKQKHIA